MRAQDINTYKRVYDAIVKLDTDIILLDKRAISLANKEQTCKLALDFIEDIEKVETAGKQNYVQMSDGSYLPLFSFNHVAGCAPSNSAKVQNRLNLDLTDIETLHVIDVLIVLKKQERRKHIQELKDLGFTIG